MHLRHISSRGHRTNCLMTQNSTPCRRAIRNLYNLPIILPTFEFMWRDFCSNVESVEKYVQDKNIFFKAIKNLKIII